MKVGTIVKLKIGCLGNKKGTLGVVFHDYGDGSQAIFKNGEYDGFSDGEVSAFLEIIGFSENLANYKFKNVMQVSIDFNEKVFAEIWNDKQDEEEIFYE